ncbi:hypothetical protein PQO03_07085 [Lentisphaera profundi]|uniref:Uncharacterized protein n=1 Tax=Lentisphaera profundi TaxID=1658616 RepID=A0ABY7VN26_9BACT|nr:hypothetical protein [Lentisphaera profundi]WDE95481.1 hypothetical protein PQO03_07085 [Lentisphaera profundi]
MKKLVMLAVLLLVTTVSASQEMLKLMPASNKLVMLFDIAKSLQIPLIAEGLDAANQDPQVQQFIKATGFSIKDCEKLAMSMDIDVATGQPNENSAIMLVELSKSIDLDKVIAAGIKTNKGVNFQKQDFKGQSLYLLKNEQKSNVGMDELAMVLLKDKLLAVGAPAAVKSQMQVASTANLTSNANLMKLLKDNKGVFALAIDTSDQPDPQPGQQPNPMSSVKGIALSGDMNKGELFVNLNAECFKAEQAAGLMFMYNMMVAPQLQKPQSPIKANEMSIAVDQSMVKVQLHLSKARLEEIRLQVEAMKQLQNAGGASVQPATGQNPLK